MSATIQNLAGRMAIWWLQRGMSPIEKHTMMVLFARRRLINGQVSGDPANWWSHLVKDRDDAIERVREWRRCGEGLGGMIKSNLSAGENCTGNQNQRPESKQNSAADKVTASVAVGLLYLAVTL